jgi:PilZ domain-containing protein
MAQAQEIQPDRRRVNRTALSLSATVRDGAQTKAKARVIDMSTHGCRVECPSAVAAGSWVWLGITGLETQHCRVVWHCHEFAGLEFEKPLSEAVFERLLQQQTQLPKTEIDELRNIAGRAHSLARQAGDDEIHLIAELSRQCAVDAIVEGLRLSQDAKKAAPKA